MASVKISGLPEQNTIADDDYLVFGKDVAMKILLSTFKAVLGIIDVLTKANIANSYDVNTDGFALDARAGKDLNERLANWYEITQAELFNTYNGNGITDFRCYRHIKTMRLFVIGTGAITTNAAGRFLIGQLKSTYRPKIPHSCGVQINGTTGGQVFKNATIHITENGYVHLVTGESNKTYGNDSYPWTSGEGIAITWDIS